MSRLKHPIRAIREPFGKAGLTVAICALVMAMVGGAYAAGGLTKSQEKQVKKIAKKYAGKPGAPGANGTNGANGSPGAPGKNGTNGEPGANGKSVVTSAASGGECTGGVGGTKFEVEESGSPSHVCNGSPWTAGGTLPKGSTETGSYVAQPEVGTTEIETEVEGTKETHTVAVASTVSKGTISFPIPLSTAAAEAITPVYVKRTETSATGCPGTQSEPEAEEGFLCVYEGGAFSSGIAELALIVNPGGGGSTLPVATSGAFVGVIFESAGGEAIGTFAVTSSQN